MSELAASHLKVRKNKAKKSSMMNKMGLETEKFFLVLSTKDWDARKPKLNAFMQ
jgi:phosphoribosylaminoimidazole carboxylase (NCAIR synthetase)